MTHANLAALCAIIYDTLDGWDHVSLASDVVVAHKVVCETDCIVFRGSQTTKDWFRDLDALAVYDPIVGYVHRGFFRGMYDAQAVIAAWPMQQPKRIVTGHSLGGARALIYGAMCKSQGGEIVTFGAPRPGFANLASLAQQWKVTEYRNCRDPVPEVPVWFPLMPYCSVVERTEINNPSAENDAHPFMDHRIALYRDGLAGNAVHPDPNS